MGAAKLFVLRNSTCVIPELELSVSRSHGTGISRACRHRAVWRVQAFEPQDIRAAGYHAFTLRGECLGRFLVWQMATYPRLSKLESYGCCCNPVLCCNPVFC